MGKGHGRRTSQTERAILNLTKWSNKAEWVGERDKVIDEHLCPACEDFGLEPEELSGPLGAEAYACLLGFAFEDFVSRRFGPDGRNPVDDYLTRRAWAESAPGKRYLRAVRDSVVSLYEVTDLKPGHHLFLRDLIRGGASIQVEERLGSEDSARWDRLAARVIDLGGRKFLAGGLLLFPFEAAESLQRVFDRGIREAYKAHRRGAKRLGLSEEEPRPELVDSLLAESAPLFTRLWLMHTLDALQQPLPRMTNFDGEELVFSEVRFPLKASREEVQARLDSIEALDRIGDAEPRWVWLPTGGPSRSRSVDQDEGGLRFLSFPEKGGATLGSVDLRENHVVLSANSKERAERGRDLLARTLAGLVGPALTSMKTLDQALKEQEEKESGPSEAGLDLDPETNSLLLREVKDRHYQTTLEQPIPALDGRSPRHAARSKAGREKLVAWLKYLENQDARLAKESGELPYDFGWMWEELGIAERHTES
jgi:hypothetical protein